MKEENTGSIKIGTVGGDGQVVIKDGSATVGGDGSA